MYQIFSTNSDIYKISSHFEKLQQIPYHREQLSNVADEPRSYRRVEKEKLEHSSLRGTKKKRIEGHSKVFTGYKYELFELYKTDKYGNKHSHGFRIEKKITRSNLPNGSNQTFYYESEGKER